MKQDTDLDLECFLETATSQLKLPRETNYKSHWLLVDGHQPSIPQNPCPNQAKRPRKMEAVRGPTQIFPLKTGDIHNINKMVQNTRPMITHDF